MRKSALIAFAQTTTVKSWVYQTVEWNARVATIQSQLLVVESSSSRATHFILPDLKESVLLPQDKVEFLSSTRPGSRIQTIATCRHTEQTLLETASRMMDNKEDKIILLVGGNDKGPNTLSTVKAATLLKASASTKDVDLWGVANPNDKDSLRRVEEKIDAGVSGFVTQPLLSSHALEVLESYPRCCNDNDTSSLSSSSLIVYLAGLAMPQTKHGLLFWLQLLGQPELAEDPLFQSHMAFFSQPYYNTSITWSRRERQNLALRATIDGIHYMPLRNGTQDLLALLGTTR
jgi:hypothetical protein